MLSFTFLDCVCVGPLDIWSVDRWHNSLVCLGKSKQMNFVPYLILVSWLGIESYAIYRSLASSLPMNLVIFHVILNYSGEMVGAFVVRWALWWLDDNKVKASTLVVAYGWHTLSFNRCLAGEKLEKQCFGRTHLPSSNLVHLLLIQHLKPVLNY